MTLEEFLQHGGEESDIPDIPLMYGDQHEEDHEGLVGKEIIRIRAGMAEILLSSNSTPVKELLKLAHEINTSFFSFRADNKRKGCGFYG